MLKKITEPQAVYQKAHSSSETTNAGAAAGASSAPFSNTPKVKRSKFNPKIVTSILAVSVFAVVAVAGVLVAQRQQNNPGPVAPNAPESKPQAANELRCSLSFEVKPTVVTPPGAADCISKTATKIAGTQRTPLAANAKVKPGDLIEYTITVGTKADTTKVEIRDLLPITVDYVAKSAKLDGTAVTLNPTEIQRNILAVSFDVAAANRGKQNKLTYQVRVKQSVAATQFTNKADIKFNNNATLMDSCQISLATELPATGTASCESKLAYNATGAQYDKNDFVRRGSIVEYKIKVSAEQTTSGAVVVTDTIPAALQLDANSILVDGKKVTGTTYDDKAAKITVPLGIMAANNTKETKVISYKATLKSTATPRSSFNNSVVVSTNGQAARTPDACTSTLRVAAEGVAQCEDKTAFTDYNGTAIADKATVQRGQTIAYKLKITATEATLGKVVVTDQLPSSLEWVEAKTEGVTFNQDTRTLTADLGVIGNTTTNKEKFIEFKAKVKADAPQGEITNTANITTKAANPDTCSHTVIVPYTCNSSCTTDQQCASGNTNWVCSASSGNRCRLGSNTNSTECRPADATYSCNSSCENDAQCQTGNSNYKCAETSQGKRCRLASNEVSASCETAATPTPTPTIGCNASCATNADCTNPAHICYSTDDGSQRCRLDTNPQSASCSTPTASTQTTPVQPQMPEELPQTGPDDWVNWLKAGLVTLGVGAVLLLLL